MAVQRRTWPQIKAEVIRRLKGVDAVGFDTRVEQWIYQALLDLGTTLHHFELDTGPTVLTLSTAGNSVALPANTFIVVGAPQLLEPGTGAIDKPLLYQDFRSLESYYTGLPGQPSRWSRFGSTFYVDALPQSPYTVNLFTYALPAAPDFSPSATGTSPLGAETDEYVMTLALALAWGEIDREDLAEFQGKKYDKWVQSQVRPPLNQVYLTELKEQLSAGGTYGGAQG
jgi:hypothetical protein